MKRIGLIAAIIFIMVAAGIIFIDVKEQSTEITRAKTKVGFILNGKIDDNSWGQSHYEGMQRTADELNLDVTYLEDVPENLDSILYIEKLVDEGNKIIIADSFGYGEAMLKAAKEYPEVYFFHATGVEESENLCTFFGRIYQERFLSGIVAGLQTDTDEIGYVAAYDIPEVVRGINAFTLGVRSVNPNAKVHVKWCYSWGDDAKIKDATNIILEECPNIDIITAHNDSLETYNVAAQKGIGIIGYNKDNSEIYPNTFLTAPVWNWDVFYTHYIRLALQDKFEGKHYWEGSETGVIGLAPLTKNVKPGIQEKVDKARMELESGTKDVFYGPIVDNEGKTRVDLGESMTDKALLNDMDWFVEGVEVYEEK